MNKFLYFVSVSLGRCFSILIFRCQTCTRLSVNASYHVPQLHPTLLQFLCFLFVLSLNLSAQESICCYLTSTSEIQCILNKMRQKNHILFGAIWKKFSFTYQYPVCNLSIISYCQFVSLFEYLQHTNFCSGAMDSKISLDSWYTNFEFEQKEFPEMSHLQISFALRCIFSNTFFKHIIFGLSQYVWLEITYHLPQLNIYKDRIM